MHEAWVAVAALAGLIAGVLLMLVVRPDRRPALAAAEAARDAALKRISEQEAAAARDHEARLADRQQLEAQAREIGGLRTRAAALEKQLADQGESHAALAEKFRLLAGEALESATARLTLASQERLDPLLKPLQERIGEFQKKVEETYAAEARERISLAKEIELTLRTSQQLGTQADALARALKGQSQMRGELGETMLERVLQAAGLQPDLHYVVQGRGLGLRDEAGGLQKPDVIVRLPEDRCIIIDSKVALNDFAAFAAAEDEAARARALAAFVRAVRGHVGDLSGKRYQDNDTLRTPDLVLLYMPFEQALAVAMQADPDLFATAWQKRVAIVGPNTLVATLRVVERIWRTEQSRANAEKIAEVAGRLVDQLAQAMGSLNAVGGAIGRAEEAYRDAMKRLFTGNGNVQRRAEMLRQLGARSRKELPVLPPGLEEAEVQEAADELAEPTTTDTGEPR